MKIEISSTSKIEVEIEIPSYYQKSCHSYKVVSEKKVLNLCDLEGYEAISQLGIGVLFACGEPNKITAKQFDDKMYEISNKLQLL
jgi:hypothetical protein